MLLLDSFLFLSIIAVLHYMKFRYPNFLFFCKGAVMFLAPQQPQSSGTKPIKKSPTPQQQQIRVIQIQYPHVKQHPKADEHDRILIILTSLILYLPFRYLLTNGLDFIGVLPIETMNSSFTFILLVVFAIYLLKVGLTIFWVSSYNIKYCILISIGINTVFFLAAITLRGVTGTHDNILWVLEDFVKQIGIVYGVRLVADPRIVIAGILGVNAVITVVGIPAVIKFGNWYTKTLKQLYHQSQQNQQNPSTKQVSPHIKTIRLLNIHLVTTLLFLFLSHSYIHNYISQPLTDLLRFVLIAISTGIILVTIKDAIQFNASFAYRFVERYLGVGGQPIPADEEKTQLRSRILQYLYYIFYHLLQLLFRIIIPLILFMTVLEFRYLGGFGQVMDGTPVVGETHCGGFRGALHGVEGLFKCPISPQTNTPTLLQQASQSFLNGMLVHSKTMDSPSQIRERMQKYGLLNPNLIEQISEQLLWYSNLTMYAMTIVYILFLRKTVYDM